MTCSHMERGGVYYKRSYKGTKLEPSKKSDNTPAKCQLCFIYGVWHNRALETRLECLQIGHTRPPTMEIDQARNNEGDKVPGNFRNFPPCQNIGLQGRDIANGKGDWEPFAVELESGQFGEAYHVLVCQLLLKQARPKIRESLQVQVTYKPCSNSDEKQRWMKEIKDLLHWYKSSDASQGQRLGGPVAKSNATSVIASAFRAANAYNKNKAPGNKLDLSLLIRKSLQLQMEKDTNPWNCTLARDTRYLCPAYDAKYWLNRYFRLTRQFGKVEAKQESHHIYNGMPKQEDVGLVAVIHIRRTPVGSKVRREMDSENLVHVLESIQHANRRYADATVEAPTLEHPPQRFTHVILYGDFTYSEGVIMRTVARKHLHPHSKADHGAEEKLQAIRDKRVTAKKGRSWMPGAKLNGSIRRERKKQMQDDYVHVSLISRPWTGSDADSEEDRKSHRAIFELWENFRDPAVDKLPIQVKVLGIWTALRERFGNKICVIGHRSGFIEGAGLIGIPIFYLNNERTTMGALPKEQDRFLYDASAVPDPESDRLRELADVMNTFIPVEALESRDENSKSTEPLHVPSGWIHELPAALFMFMCCPLESGRPAWTARVELMHQQRGQSWLRDRCNYIKSEKPGAPKYDELVQDTGLSA